MKQKLSKIRTEWVRILDVCQRPQPTNRPFILAAHQTYCTTNSHIVSFNAWDKTLKLYIRILTHLKFRTIPVSEISQSMLLKS